MELHFIYNEDNSCLKQTALAGLLFPFHRLLFYFWKSLKSTEAITAFIMLLKAETNFQQCLVATSSTPQQGPKNKLGSLSAVSQTDFPSGVLLVLTFLLLCHLHLPKSQVWSVTDYETCHILGRRLQGRCAHRVIDPKGQVSYPTHLWYPTSSCSA